jgi:hypothetical protein
MMGVTTKFPELSTYGVSTKALVAGFPGQGLVII